MTKTCFMFPAIALVVSSCVIDPQHVEKDFGNSVRQMVAAQIIDPETASNPDLMAPDILDGAAGDTTVERYRQDFERKKEANDRFTISVN